MLTSPQMILPESSPPPPTGQQRSTNGAPPGEFSDPPPPCPSHVWRRDLRYDNLTWRAPAQPSQPPPRAVVPADGDRLIQIQIPMPRRVRRAKRVGALELCCGHAGLTAALWDHGLEATGIDWKRNKHQPTVPILNVDLTTEAGQAFVMRLLSEEHVLYVHMGPPCGTFTRARERPIPEWQMRMGAPCPQPLRSDDHPEGLPANELSELDLLKVRKGNAIAEFCAQVAQHCIEHGKYFSIENPTGSLLWKLPCYRTLLSHDDVRSVDFHACM